MLMILLKLLCCVFGQSRSAAYICNFVRCTVKRVAYGTNNKTGDNCIITLSQPPQKHSSQTVLV